MHIHKNSVYSSKILHLNFERCFLFICFFPLFFVPENMEVLFARQSMY